MPRIVPTTPRMRAYFIGCSGASRAVSQAPAMPMTRRYKLAMIASPSVIGSPIGGYTPTTCRTISTTVVTMMMKSRPATTAQMLFHVCLVFMGKFASGRCQVSAKLVERATPPGLHAFAAAVEGLPLGGGRLVRQPIDCHRRPAGVLREGDLRQQLQRPRIRRERMWRDAALRIRERVDPHQPRRRHHLAIDRATPKLFSVRQGHAVVRHSVGTGIELRQVHVDALRAEPAAEVARFGPYFPHRLARDVELATDDEGFALQAGQVFGEALERLLSALDGAELLGHEIAGRCVG